MAGAMTAIATFAATRISPTSAIFLRNSSRSHRPRSEDTVPSIATRLPTAPSAELMSASRDGPTPRGSLVADPRVDDEVGEIHEQVDHGVRDGDEQHDALDHRVVGAQHREADE